MKYSKRSKTSKHSKHSKRSKTSKHSKLSKTIKTTPLKPLQILKKMTELSVEKLKKFNYSEIGLLSDSSRKTFLKYAIHKLDLNTVYKRLHKLKTLKTSFDIRKNILLDIEWLKDKLTLIE